LSRGRIDAEPDSSHVIVAESPSMRVHN